ncbi:hypothetical protein BA20089_07630 [Bifidobacterium asteroides DSM 20089]|uniref:Uncharacterized protein n=1 Tax=Bifidobacterium asteroides DSM 20089 TaxID=1437594 RepID=A0AAD0AB60_9BIFI|nr:hypothetical protein BAST_1665 [Bifidobacterium asteroides PRL2011]ATO41999.1 hypothetical protein BA20089_07630 [Bifidobacterium asteroides DSM 20089]
MVERGEPKTEGATSQARRVSYPSSSIPVVKKPQWKHQRAETGAPSILDGANAAPPKRQHSNNRTSKPLTFNNSPFDDGIGPHP